MGVLETMFGQIGDDTDGSRAKFTSHRYDVAYTVSEESHDIAYAVPIRRVELDAFADLVELERETPYVSDGGESLEESLDSVLEDDSIDAETWAERMEAPRGIVEPVLERWDEIVSEDETDEVSDDGGPVSDDQDAVPDDEDDTEAVSERESDEGTDAVAASAVEIVYLPLETESAFAAFFQVCRKRDANDHDPFELPANISTAAAVLTQIKRATDRSERRVVVNRTHLPDL